MVLHNVFSSCVYYQYKAYTFSKATAVVVIISTLTLLFPLMFTYRSHGFYLRTDTYQEQPIVNFKYDYVLYFDVLRSPKKKPNRIQETLICSSIKKEVRTTGYEFCPLIRAYEEDLNGDGLYDILYFKTKLFPPSGSEIIGISFMLLFDYKLTRYCRAQFEGAAFVQHLSQLPGAGMQIMGDLSLFQRQPLDPWYIDVRYNETIMPKEHKDKPIIMVDALMEYSRRNISTRLTNVYKSWITRVVASEPFELDLIVVYPEVIVRFTPTKWQVFRFAWAQFLPLLIVSVYIFQSIKDFIFSNQLVSTYREEPWTKDSDKRSL